MSSCGVHGCKNKAAHRVKITAVLLFLGPTESEVDLCKEDYEKVKFGAKEFSMGATSKGPKT